MLYTLTLNTAIDMNIRCNGLQPNSVNRTTHTEYSPNGKGVNVSLVLNHFGMPSVAMGYFGGFSGQYIYDELIKRGIPTQPCWIEETTRINVFINDGQQEYKLVGQGPFIEEQKKAEMLSQLTQLTDCDHLVISGSLPNNLQPDFYENILTICQQKAIAVILDISHPHLRHLLAYKPLLIKPNDDEVREVFGLETRTHAQVIDAMTTLHALGAQNVLLTLGANGLYFSTGHQLWFCDAVAVELVSSACAGDASLAAFLSEWLMGRDIEHALKKAAATGANVAESDGIGPLNKVSDYLHQLTVTQIK